ESRDLLRSECIQDLLQRRNYSLRFRDNVPDQWLWELAHRITQKSAGRHRERSQNRLCTVNLLTRAFLDQEKPICPTVMPISARKVMNYSRHKPSVRKTANRKWRVTLPRDATSVPRETVGPLCLPRLRSSCRSHVNRFFRRE